MTVIIFLIILAVLVFVHELGHFLVAKISGIRVDEFSIGFPPRLFKKKIGETLYSLNLIPFGGYVKIFGENPDEESMVGSDSSRSFVNKPKKIQVAVLVAGVIGNLLFAWLLIVGGYMFGLPTSVSPENEARIRNAHVVVTTVAPNTPAELVGIKLGDSIVSVASPTETLSSGNVTPESVQQFICSHGEEELTVSVLRKGETMTFQATPQAGIVADCRVLGIVMDYVGILRLPPHLALVQGTIATAHLAGATVQGLYLFLASIFQGTADFSAVSGPVGIAGMVGDAQSLGFSYLIFFTALISINLAVINLVPFPALDGGRILFVLIEAVLRRSLNPRVANMVNAAGFLLLMALLVILTYRDILKL